ncbi:hypothetical protein E6H36_07925 [Candidatus Bathyarchaeota archaeon]|nr:MAG: hypothetical protein E6H36_07925 [Candidatus Bathyarchaeota archaeon]TMI29034.1 MAG: hypothetical protein E6H29_12095 [Candidatus Bathyarchaeota archaeon]
MGEVDVKKSALLREAYRQHRAGVSLRKLEALTGIPHSTLSRRFKEISVLEDPPPHERLERAFKTRRIKDYWPLWLSILLFLLAALHSLGKWP